VKRKEILLIMFILTLTILFGVMAVPRDIEILYQKLYPSSTQALLVNQADTAKMLVAVADGLLSQEGIGKKMELSPIEVAQFTQLAIDNRDEIEELGIKVEKLIAQVERYLIQIEDFNQAAGETEKINIRLGANSWLEVRRATGPGRGSYGASHRNPHTFNINIDGQVAPLVSLKTNLSLNHIYGATAQIDRNWGFEINRGSLYTGIGPFRTQYGTLRFDYGNLAASFTPLVR